MSTWSAPQPDILGGPFLAASTALTRRDGGINEHLDRAVIVHRDDADAHRSAVVYLPGFIDSFYHRHVAHALDAAGWGLYALDMRRSGRSLAQGQRRDDVRDLRIRNEEVSAAVAYARSNGAEEVILLGHSTGGLQALIYAQEYDDVDGLALNSPWLDLYRSWFERGPVTELLKLVGPLIPGMRVGWLTGEYGAWISDPEGGGWKVPDELAPEVPDPVYAGFLRSVRIEQARIAKGLNLKLPVFVACSRRTGQRVDPPPRDLATSDVVLDVRDTIRLSSRLSSDLSLRLIDGGVHDLALSLPEPRLAYLAALTQWLNRPRPGAPAQ